MTIENDRVTNEDLVRRTELLYQERFTANCRRIDRWFAYLMLAQWAFAIIVTLLVSPWGWEGNTRTLHTHVYLAVLLGGALSSAPIILAFTRPGWVGTRHTIGIAQMLWSALLIHLMGGRVETHFHVFGSLAFLAAYRDWKVLVPATVVVAADHLIRQLFWPESVYGTPVVEWWRFLEHAGWVVFEDIFLFAWCFHGMAEMREMSRQQTAIEVHERAAATRIQTSVLPRKIEVSGLEAAARMTTADEVGGDYYDVHPTEDGGWICVGDVAGHGVRAGLTMLQAQSAMSALVRHEPHAAPAKLWESLNRAYVENIRRRLGQNEHMTFSLLRYYRDGRIDVVGAHEELLIWRDRTNECQTLPIRGTWIGIPPHRVTPSIVEQQSFRLDPGDLLVLYTDGIIEAKDQHGKAVGLERVRDLVVQRHAEPVEAVRDAIFELAKHDHSDDASVLVFRYVGERAAAAA